MLGILNFIETKTLMSWSLLEGEQLQKSIVGVKLFDFKFKLERTFPGH